jgi:G3E family GTPase
VTGQLPLHVLTGFLGSGKTTLLNRLVRAPALADSAVLINEIGAVAIDHHLVHRLDGGDAMDVVVLAGGCLCCTVRGDLVAALRELYDRRAAGMVPAFSRVILETTGLADPAPVLFTLTGDPVLRHKFAAGGILATVDAVPGALQLARHPECRKQVAVADRMVITKSDIADGSAGAHLRDMLTRINPAAEIMDAHTLGGLDRLFDASALRNVLPARSGAAAAQPMGNSAEHTHDVEALSLTLDVPLEWAPFSVWLSLLLHAHGENILRFKAMLEVAGWDAPVVVDGVHHLIHPPTHLPAWPDGPRTSRIVVIAQGISMRRVERSLRDFLALHGDTGHTPRQAVGAR